MRAAKLAAAIGAGWPKVLKQCGIGAEFLRNTHGPCPACGGTDRFRFDNKGGRGGFFCNRCGAGDGFRLLQLVHGWDFRTALSRVSDVSGVGRNWSAPEPRSLTTRAVAPSPPAIASPAPRVRRLRAQTCRLADCSDAVTYLTARGLWPAAASTSIRAHAAMPYYDNGTVIGTYAALVADVTDIAGELVTVHVTHLDSGHKASVPAARKLLGPLTGRDSCAVRLVPIRGDTMGIAEGIESAMSALILTGVPTWAAINASLLGKFAPPPSVTKLVLFADRDVAGLEAATKLFERLQGRVAVAMRAPPAPHKDWNDVLMFQGGA